MTVSEGEGSRSAGEGCRPPRGALRLTGPALSGILFAALTVGVTARSAALIGTDEALSDAARSWSLHDPALHSAMAALSRTGSSAVLVTAGAVAVAVLLVRRLWREAAFVVLAAVATTLVRWVVRASVARPRPAGRLAPADGWAFPSGHTTSSTVAALIAVVLLVRLVSPGRWRSAAVVTLSVWAVGVGLSRVFLVVHWPTDVLGGWLLAASAVPLCALAVLGPRRRLTTAGRRPAAQAAPRGGCRQRLRTNSMTTGMNETATMAIRMSSTLDCTNPICPRK